MLRQGFALICLFCGCLGDGKSIMEGFESLGEELGDLSDRVNVLEESSYESTGGRWHLAMNINPDDGHIFGYVNGEFHCEIYINSF